MSKVLVTGGSGFIGSNLCRLLHESGHSVLSLDMKESSPKPWGVVVADIREFQVPNDIEIIIHLAAQISVAHSVTEPEETFSINVEGTKNIVKGAVSAGVRRFIFASSAAVYGDAEMMPITESAPLLPQSPYAESKIQGEVILNNSELMTCSMRFFNVYGHGQSATGGYAAVIPAFKKAISLDDKPNIFGDGSQVRDFVHVSDLVRIIEIAINCEELPTEVNIASGEKTSLLGLLSALKVHYPSMRDPIFEAERAGDIHTSVADISKMVQYFNPGKMIGLSEGLQY
jgi:nucleoside-diphosphate-sugar epimerase